MTFLHLIVASSLSYLQDSKNFSATRLMGSPLFARISNLMSIKFSQSYDEIMMNNDVRKKRLKRDC